MRRTLTVLLAVLLCGCGARENKEHGIRFSSATVTKMDDSSGVAVLTEKEDGKRTVEVPYRSSVTVIRDGKTISGCLGQEVETVNGRRDLTGRADIF